MATISRRGDFQWQAKIRVKGFDPVSKTFNTRADAELWAATVESEMGRGIYQDRSEAERTTLLEALERYEQEVSAKKDGHDQERWRIRSWKNDTLAKRSMASLRGADFAKWRDVRLKAVSASTVKKDLAVISHLFTVAAKEWGLAVQNPIQSITLPQEDNARDRRLENDEEERLLSAFDKPNGKASNNWILPLVRIAIETASRQSELLALEWKDVSALTMRIRGKEREDGKRRTKNRDKFRDVPLSPAARSVFADLPRSISGKVFPTTASAVKQSFARACRRAGIEDLRFHDLRHEATSRLAEKLQLHELMKVTGHKDTRMLARYYHPRAEELAKKLG